MTLPQASDSFQGALEGNRRRSEIFRKGVVAATDETVTPFSYQLSDGSEAKPMPATQTGLEEGDIVVWVDDLDPFILGKFAGT